MMTRFDTLVELLEDYLPEIREARDDYHNHLDYKQNRPLLSRILYPSSSFDSRTLIDGDRINLDIEYSHRGRVTEAIVSGGEHYDIHDSIYLNVAKRIAREYEIEFHRHPLWNDYRFRMEISFDIESEVNRQKIDNLIVAQKRLDLIRKKENMQNAEDFIYRQSFSE